MAKYRQSKLTLPAHRALKEIVNLTGLKMWAALEQAVLSKLTAVKADKEGKS